MMNTTVNSNSHYKDWLFMDCYIGVNRQALGAYIMRSASGRTSWAESAELLGTHNWSTYCAAKSHTHSTLTFSAGAFGAKSYNGGSAVTVSVPTHTSHITNNSGFITTAATVTNSDKLDGYHGSSANTANNYVLRGSSGQINVGAISSSSNIKSMFSLWLKNSLCFFICFVKIPFNVLNIIPYRLSISSL